MQHYMRGYASSHQSDSYDAMYTNACNYAATPQAHQDPSWALPNTTHLVPCLWGGAGSCPIMLDDTTAAGIMRHLREYHLCTDDQPWDKKARGLCQWGGNCGKEMAYASFGKHVAAIHLRGSTQCPQCHLDIGRPGLLERHMRSYCTQGPTS